MAATTSILSESRLFDDALLEAVRQRIAHIDVDPFGGPRIYFENAGGSLTLKAVGETAAREALLGDNTGRPSPTAMHVQEVINQGKRDVALFLDSEEGVILSGESVTANIFRVINTVARQWSYGNLVATNLDHACTYDATRAACSQYSLDWRVVNLDPVTALVQPEAVAEKVDADTRLVTVIHSSNVVGTVNNVHSIAKAVRLASPEAFILIDGTQHAPHGPTRISEMDIDAYFFAPYKSFSMHGCCFAWLSDRLAEVAQDRLQGKSPMDWDLGTRAPARYSAWSTVVDYFAWLGSHFTNERCRKSRVFAGMKAIQAHERALLHVLLDGNDGDDGMRGVDGVTIAGSVDPGLPRDPLLHVVLDHVPPRELVTRRGVDAYAGHALSAVGSSSGMRVSLCHYNTPEEISVFLGHLRGLLA